MTHNGKRPFRFGVSAIAGSSSSARWREKARKVEDLGYSTLFALDHVKNTLLAPIAAISFAAEATKTLRVGTLVVDNDFRHPGLLAKEMATIDLLSEGRLELGIGAGWWLDDYTALGMPFDPPGIRIDRLCETVDIVKQFFGGGMVNHRGAYYDIQGLEARPSVVQKPRPPLILGGSRRRMLSLGAREADIVSVNCSMEESGPTSLASGQSSTVDATLQKIKWIREAAPDRFDSLELQCPLHVVSVAEDPSSEIEAFAAQYGVDDREARASPIALFGSIDEIAERLEERRELFGFSYLSIPDRALDAFAPVVSRLAGA